MAKIKQLSSLQQPLIFVSVVWLILGFLFVNYKVDDLRYEKYKDISTDMQNRLKGLIKEKQEATLVVSFAIANNQTIRDALLNNSISGLNLDKFSDELSKYTSLQNSWFQLSTHEGKSFYRSWTDKRGDDLTAIRKDIVEMVNNPAPTSSISPGLFNLTFKAMVPIFEDGRFIGTIETISDFNSVAKMMTQEGYETLLLVDKSYKKLLLDPSSKNYIGDYYLANSDINNQHVEIIKNITVEHVVNWASFYIDEEQEHLISTYHLHDKLDKELAYFVIFKDLKDIDFSDITRTTQSLILFILSIFLFLIGIYYFFYTKKQKEYIQEMNIHLEKKVQTRNQALIKQSKKLEHVSQYDSLTKLPNRALLINKLKRSIEKARGNKQSITILFLDLDRFKEINDTYSHEVGDTLLKKIADKLKTFIDESDTIARFGGDEFTIILNNANDTQTMELVANITDAMHDAISVDNLRLHTTFSIGISTFPQDGESAEILLRNADTAMYGAKSSGKNRYQFYNAKMTELAFERVLLESNLRKAIKENEFEAYFQPKIDATTQKVIGLEALIRWRHPELGLIAPAKFIPFAEDIGLIIEIDKWMMRVATAYILECKKENITTGKLSINASAKQIEDKGYIDDLKSFINESGVDTKDLEIEITEGLIMKNTAQVISVLKSIKDLGISISIDDFGTGYSSLSYIKRLPIDKLKIDRSFIKDIPEDKEDIAIVRTIIALANNLSLELIAEGVETQEQVDFLVREGCVNIQGYFYSKPLCANECKDFLISHM
ncbi:EAL domain-containing protein [Sulfurimonas sp.]|uniref:bifunctional diguanylate cyclase/phosphodiesterase n=1 Tax=Sulfurimonas sp. TaxID=2022749 RepID=UPI0025DF41D2|nr:EAL domain-containing protein [Sulfurimonas sp.]MBW6489197.1 EAL domain-containing protein [Sulfurimonas sp.]